MIEPSDMERADLPHASAEYMSSLEDRVEELEEALHKIRNWCQAYPVSVFIPPTKEEVNASIEAMKAPGCASSEAMHGSWARHILDGIIAHVDVVNEELDHD